MVSANIVNTIGLSINILGGLMMFWGTPRVTSGVWLYTDTEQRDLFRKDRIKNRVIRFGFVLLTTGSIVQLIALWM